MVKCYRCIPYVKYVLPLAGICLLLATHRSYNTTLDVRGLNATHAHSNSVELEQRVATENTSTLATIIEHPDEVTVDTKSDATLVSKVPSVQETTTKQECLKMRESDIVKHFKGLKDSNINISTPVTISPSSVCGNGIKDPYVLILIASTEPDVQQRQTVRDTWASFRYNKSLTLSGGATVGVVFIVAGNGSTVPGPGIQQEVKQYGDILWLDMEESYQNLIYKVFAGMQWMTDNCRDTQFLLKVDIDVYVNIPNLIPYVRNYRRQRVVIGRRHFNAGVFRTGRWGVTLEQYKFCTYLPYTEGNSYVISAKLVPELLNAARRIPNFHIEDAFITGVLRSVVGANLVDSKIFSNFAKSIDRSDLSKFYKDGGHFISETRCSVEIMNKLWSIYMSSV